MSCFDELVGIKSICTETESTSGLYIEDIGITANEADSYINSEYASGEELLKDKIRFASTLVSKNINNHFASYINSKSLIDSQRLGIYGDNLIVKSGFANNYGGINLRLLNYSSYLSIFVSSISIQLTTTATVPVKVINLITGEVLDTISIDAVANTIVTKFINKTYESSKQNLDLIFVYDTTGLNSNSTMLANFSSTGAGCSGCNGYRYSNAYIYSAPIYIPTSSQQIRTNITGGQHTFGLSINYSVQCSVNNWLCEMSNLMSLPILYKAGELVMDYALLYSDRQNSDTNIDYERNKERKIAYKDSFNEALESTIKQINMPKGDICFKCNDFLVSKIILP